MPLRDLHAARTARRRAQPEADNPFQMFKPALKMLSVEPVGNYAIRINWSDGHNTGIYSYEHFRRICQCAECRSRRRKVRSKTITPDKGAVRFRTAFLLTRELAYYSSGS